MTAPASGLTLPDLPGFHLAAGIPVRDYSADDDTTVDALVAYGHGHAPAALWAAFDAYAVDQLGWAAPGGRLPDQLAHAAGEPHVAERWAVLDGDCICWDEVDPLTAGSVPVTVLEPAPEIPESTDKPTEP